MSILSRSILKTYFETGDRPTQPQFGHVLDSYVHMNDDNTGNVTILGTLSATTGSFGYITMTGTTDFDSITVGGGYSAGFGGSGLTIDTNGALQTDSYLYADGVISSSVKITTPIINNLGTDAITIQNPLLVLGSITASGDISASGTVYADAFESATGGSAIDFNDTVDIDGNISASGNIILDGTEGHLSASRVSASAGFEADTDSTSSFGYISASGDLSASGAGYFAGGVETDVTSTGSFGYISASGDISSSGTGSFFGGIDAAGATGSFGGISASGHISASTLQIANNAQFGASTIYIKSALGHVSASRVSASAGFEAGPTSTSSFGYISASGDISSSAKVHGLTGSFGYLEGDGSGLTGVTTDGIHGNKPSTTGSITIPENTNNTVVTNNTGEFTINDDYTVKAGAQVDLQYTVIAERLFRIDPNSKIGAGQDYIAYAQANIDSETTLMKGFGAGTAGVGNDSTIRHNATVPENFTAILHTNLNVTQSEDPNNNPMTTDPHSITIQDQSTYTVKQGADVTVDGVHHGVVRKDIALFKTMGIGDTQAIGPSGSDSFNDQYNNIYPSASAHLHISASNPILKIEASSGTGLLDIEGNISASKDINATGTGSFDGGVILTSPNGTKYIFTVNNSGHLSITGSVI